MTPGSRITQVVGRLTRAADDVPLAVALSTDGGKLELLAPPQHLATSCDVFATRVLGQLLDRFGPGGLSTVGVLAPVALDEDGLRTSRRATADGMLVCAAERGAEGSASAAVLRTHGGPWREADAEADWICDALRALVTRAGHRLPLDD